METYERLICDLGHCLLTKGLNNDFTECQGSGDGCDVHRGMDTKNIAPRIIIMLLDRYSKTLCDKVNFSSQIVSHKYFFFCVNGM